MKTTWLAEILVKIGITFEKANPALFRLLAAILPYSTPIPVAWLTMDNSATFLGFPPKVAFVFVFGLEGMGIWFTSLFVDAVVDWIRSRNWKTFSLVIIFGIVVAVYVSLLVNLNVTLELASGNVNPAYSRIITLLCFLPLLTGVGNGYYKMKIEYKYDSEAEREWTRQLEEKIRQERRQDRISNKMIKAGMLPVQYQSNAPKVREKPRDWRNLNDEEKYRVVHVLTVKEIMDEFPVSEATAYNWKSKNL
jgi:hypothetical protein